MRGAKYSVVLGGHYSVHAVFKCATNSANTTILGHIRITNTPKLGSCVSTQGRRARIAALLHRASKQALAKFTTGVKQWKLSRTGHGQFDDHQTNFLFFLFCIIYSKGAPSTCNAVRKCWRSKADISAEDWGVVDQLRNFLIKCEPNKLIKVQTDSAGVKFDRNWG